MVKPAALPMPWIGGGGSTRSAPPRSSPALVQADEQRAQILALAALAPVLEDDVGDAGIGERGVVVERRDAGDA